MCGQGYTLKKSDFWDLPRSHQQFPFMVDFGWETKSRLSEIFDLDFHLFLLGEDGTVGSIDDWLSEPRYTNQLRLIPYSFKDRSGAVYHYGEVQDLLGELDYRVRIMIDLAKVPDYVYEIVIGAGIYGGRQRKQTFGRVVDAFARFHQDDGESLRFSLANDPSSKATNMVFLRFYRQTKRGGILGPWAVKAVGEGSDGGIKGLLQSFGIEAEEEMV